MDEIIPSALLAACIICGGYFQRVFDTALFFVKQHFSCHHLQSGTLVLSYVSNYSNTGLSQINGGAKLCVCVCVCGLVNVKQEKSQ